MLFKKNENALLAVLDDIELYLKGDLNTIEIEESFLKSKSILSQKLHSICNLINKKNDEELMIYGEIMLVSEKIINGVFTDKIYYTDTSNLKLNYIAKTINALITTLQNNSQEILQVLELYVAQNYTQKVDSKYFQGDFAKSAKSINILCDSISEMLVKDKSSGLTLEMNSNILLQNVDKLNESTNNAAKRLEEISLATEEILTITNNNMKNVVHLSSLSVDVQSSVSSGNEHSNQTTKAMNEINTQIEAINESISVIDQISFQTNILSLNAAVEAATAGEAGKGFAVVAQEVRNLASRSAEAANTIKKIVKNATIKANEGKKIASEMIEGYKELNSNISQTLKLIEQVSQTLNEQKTGIEQINNAINTLDQQTQENSQIASKAHDIAIETDSLAKYIVSNANEKEFIGKHDVTI